MDIIVIMWIYQNPYRCQLHYFYPITMATDSIGGGNKSHARRVISQKVVAFNYNTTLCTNRITMQALFCCHMAKGYKIVKTYFLGLPTKYNYLASAWPRPCIVFCLQSSEVGYNYYMEIMVIIWIS